jgi:hypothetical protein
MVNRRKNKKKKKGGEEEIEREDFSKNFCTIVKRLK